MVYCCPTGEFPSEGFKYSSELGYYNFIGDVAVDGYKILLEIL